MYDNRERIAPDQMQARRGGQTHRTEDANKISGCRHDPAKDPRSQIAL